MKDNSKSERKSEGCEGYFCKIIKLVVLIMGGGEHRFASRYKKKVLQIYEGPFSIVAEARLELTTFGL